MDIEFKQSKDGYKIPCIDGKGLESLAFPLRDACRWAEREQDKVAGFEKIVILGLGSGLYANALAKLNPTKKFYVIECLDEVANSSPVLDENVSLIKCCSLNDLLETEEARAIASRPFRIIRHPGAFRNSSSFYEELTQFITGRTTAGLKWNTKHRPAQAKYFRQWEKFRSGGMISGRPISIVDINRFASQFASETGYESAIWSTLRELTK